MLFKKGVFLFFVLGLIGAGSVLECKVQHYSGKAEENMLTEHVTIITTTHPIPSNPSVEMLRRTQENLFTIPAFRGCRKIIVFDGLPEDLSYLEKHLAPSELEERNIRDLASEKYEQYKENVLKLTREDPYFSNTTLVFSDEHLHLAFAIEKALEEVETPFVYIHQHDLELTKDIDAVNIIRSMECNPNIKYVRINLLSNTPENGWDTLLDDYVEGGSLAPLLRTNLWSDNEHFCSVEYYTDFILPKMPREYPMPMECLLMREEKEAIQEDVSNHLIYGTYVYGKLGDSPYLFHVDGSRHYGDEWEY